MFTRRSLVVCVSAVCLTVALVGAFDSNTPARHRATSEVRALWITRSTLTSPASVARMVATAERGGFNTLVVQVRGRGDAYYRSTLEPRAMDLASNATFDPLAHVLTLAGSAGLKVHAWVAVNLVSSAVDLPSSRQHIVYRQPDWLMVPRELAADLLTVDPRSPEYVGRLARWSRGRTGDVEGLYASPIHPWVATHTAAVLTELVTQYELDGVHLDYVRFPNDDFDYSRAALRQFKVAIRPQLSDEDRRRADLQDRRDPLAYPTLFPDRWTSFRQSRLTTLVMQVRTAVKAARPGVTLSAAVIPDVTEAARSRLQDWRTWLDQSLIDVLVPMAYTQDVDRFEDQISTAQGVAGNRAVWAGVGAYRLSTAATLEHIFAARRLKAAGTILFSYDALVSPPHSTTSLAELGRAAFGNASQ